MNISGNTILITGGGSGIGRGLAEAFHKAGNKVIVAGRRKEALDKVTTANPGIESVALDVADPQSIRTASKELATKYPNLNVVINNAGIMVPEKLKDPSSLPIAESIVTTNLLGPIRLTSALMPTLLRQSHATILNVSSGLAFLPLSLTPTYCATKAAIHSYTQTLRWQLKDTAIKVIEIIPPYVQTHLMGPQQAADPRAMPLPDFLKEVMEVLRTQPNVTEVCVEKVKPLRFAAESGKYAEAFEELNESMAAPTE
ncbi:MAG: oxidoreductase, short-chain dehydrogenase/reductase family [Verrucomicrobiales bacterium]|nr:oxidoreductase, short-chain dehydrogenase/reductase family [Verrucomicrobiales bacterium]